MKLILLLIYLSDWLKLNSANTNEPNISNNTDNKNTSNMVFNMNIYGQNVDVNLAQSYKIISPNFNFGLKAKPDKNDEKLVTANDSGLKNLGKKFKFPDYIKEVEPPNSSEIFSKKISKRNIKSDSLIFDKNANSLDDSDNSSQLNSDKYLELAVFLDYKAYENLKLNILTENDNDIHELILGFINQIQAIYYHKSLDQKLHINIVKIEIQKTQKFSQFNGNRDDLLKSFCKYQSKLNAKSDSDPSHWDMALLLTGFDLYVIKENGTRDYHSLGLGSVSGICSHERNCVIAEFQSINRLGRFWPSSGLMSTWTAAHEMAHNLGILHDGLPFNSGCPTNGFLMSSSRETRGETNWSKCSASNFRLSFTDCLNDKPKIEDQKYNHNKYKLRPGLFWDSDKQCKMFLRDNKAFEFAKTNAKICNESLLCATPERIGFHFSGPALEGTYCGENSWCVDGMCESRTTN